MVAAVLRKGREKKKEKSLNVGKTEGNYNVVSVNKRH